METTKSNRLIFEASYYISITKREALAVQILESENLARYERTIKQNGQTEVIRGRWQVMRYNKKSVPFISMSGKKLYLGEFLDHKK